MTTLQYSKSESNKIILDLNTLALNNLADSFNEFFEKIKTEDTFLVLDKTDDTDLIQIIFKNYTFMISDIENKLTQKYLHQFDKILFYYAKTIYDDNELRKHFTFDGVLNDIDQFIWVLDTNKNTIILKLIIQMFMDYAHELNTEKGSK